MALGNTSLVELLSRRTRPYGDEPSMAELARELSQARLVFIGEATHGTHEFYSFRAQLTQTLIRDHGFCALAIEGDWPASTRVRRYVRRQGLDRNAREALQGFARWPRWMWANEDVALFVSWLRKHNEGLSKRKQCGIYGLDVYSLFESLDAVLITLDRLDPRWARSARQRYACFSPFGHDEKAYVRSLEHFPRGCEKEVVEVLRELLSLRLESSQADPDEIFDVQQNARVVARAESYYRTLLLGNDDAWNVRERHMMETLDALERQRFESKIVVWAHNTHVGDHRATSGRHAARVSLGALARERWGRENVKLVGMGTYRGSVCASYAWSGPTLDLEIPPGKPGSYEASFHEVCQKNSWPSLSLALTDFDVGTELGEVRGHRAIGVVYDPAYEHFGNYVPTTLARRYDHFIFIDETRALRPFEEEVNTEAFPETWPLGV